MTPSAGSGRRNVGQPASSAGGAHLASAQQAALFGRPTSKFLLKRIAAASAHAPASPPQAAADIPRPPALAMAHALAAAVTGPALAGTGCARVAGSLDTSNSADMSEGGQALSSKRVLKGGEGRTAASSPSGDGAQVGWQKRLGAAVPPPPPPQQQQLDGTPAIKQSRLHATSTPSGSSSSSFHNGAALASASLSLAPSRLGASPQQAPAPALVSSPHQLQSLFLPVTPPQPCAAGAPAAANADASALWMWAPAAGVPLTDAAPEGMQMEEGPEACWAAPTATNSSRANSMAAAASTTAQGFAQMSLGDAMRCSVMAGPAWAPAASSGLAASGLGWAAPTPPCFWQWDSCVVPASINSAGSSVCAWGCLQAAAAGDSGVVDMQWESSCCSVDTFISAPAGSRSSGQHCRHWRSSRSSSRSSSSGRSLKRAAPAMLDSRQAAARGSDGAVTAKLKQARR